MMKTHRRILVASLVGTSVEFYDFYIYATAAALVFGPLFFPTADPATQLLSSYASLAVAFVARPVGAWAFGHYGDRIGRKSTLVASLLMMGLSTLLIAFLPTYATAGYWAPLLLCVLRFGQGFGLGGEWGGAALLAVENAPPGWRGRYGMVPQLGAPIGFVAANGLFLALGAMMTPDQFLAWGWRIPFLLSIVLVGVGLWVRLKIAETPAFAQVLEEGPPPAVPMGELLRDHWRMALAGTVGAIACFAVYYIATAFALGYATTTLGIDRQAMLGVQLGAILFMGLGIVLSGIWADRTSAANVLRWGCVGAVVAGLALPAGLGSGALGTIFAVLAFALFVMGFVYGPLGAWLPSLYPARVRYTGVSLAFNMAGIIGGGLTPVIAQSLAQRGGLGPVGLYLAGASLLSLVALLMLRGRPEVETVALEGVYGAMIHHVSVGTDDVARAKAFYDAVLPIVGIAPMAADEGGLGYGSGTFHFSVQVPIDGQPATVGNGSHIAFAVEDRAMVDRFHATALAHGGQDDGEPGLRPKYDANYYGAFVRDPDGHKLEAVTYSAK